MNQSVNSQTDVDTGARRDCPPEVDDPDSPRECDLDADDRTPEEAGYGYGV